MPDTNHDRYTVQEQFMSFQGEGVWTGQAAYFVRLYGCDQRCHFCDSAGTWHPDWIPSRFDRRTAEEIADSIPTDLPFGFVVLTGGEPTLYRLSALIDAIRDQTQRGVHIETAGHKPIDGNPNWITLSPKPFAAPPLADNVHRANEFKLIVEHPQSIPEALATIDNRATGAPVWLHPEWSKRHDTDVLRAIVSWVTTHGHPFRAGWQMHKPYAADMMDPGADQRLIPLGGMSDA